MVTIYPLAGLVGCIDALDTESQRPGSIDDSSEQQTRTETAILRNGIAHRSDEFEFVAAVAHCGYTGGEIDGSPLDLFEVRVHVPEAREQESPCRVNDVGVFRNLYFGSWADGFDASVFDHNGRVGDGGGSRAIDECRADNGERGAVTARNSLGNVSQRAHVVGSSTSDEIAQGALVSAADGFEVV